NPFSRFVYEYDSRGINTRYTYEMYSNDQWQMIYGYSTLITYLNNNSNKCLERVDSFYHSGNQIFVPEYKEIREYNANEEIVHVTYYENEDGTLFLRTRDSITYVAGLPTTLIEYEFDENTNAFYKDYK